MKENVDKLYFTKIIGLWILKKKKHYKKGEKVD